MGGASAGISVVIFASEKRMQEFDDYETMDIPDLPPEKKTLKGKKQTHLQPQKQLPYAVREEQARNVGMSKPLDASNKGFQLLQKMGFK